MLTMSTKGAVSREALEIYSLFAKWAFEFLFQPKVNALAMELMGASECFDHLAALQVLQADGATVFVLLFFAAVLLLFLKLEAWNRCAYSLQRT